MDSSLDLSGFFYSVKHKNELIRVRQWIILQRIQFVFCPWISLAYLIYLYIGISIFIIHFRLTRFQFLIEHKMLLNLSIECHWIDEMKIKILKNNLIAVIYRDNTANLKINKFQTKRKSLCILSIWPNFFFGLGWIKWNQFFTSNSFRLIIY